MTLRDLGYAITTGLLLGLLFPPFTFAALAWLAIFPLLWALDEKTPQEGLILGFVSGLIGYGIIIWWVVETMVNYGGISSLLAWLLAFTLAAYIALYVGAFSCLLVWIAPKGRYARMFMAPVIWVALEITRAYFLSGFPWALLGYSQYKVLPVIQIADLAGVYSVSFFIVLINAMFWHFFRYPGRSPYGVVGGGVLVVGLVVGYGIFRILGVPDEMKMPRPVGIVQPNTLPSQKWVPDRREAIVGDLELQTQELAQEFKGRGLLVPPLIVWPESALPLVYSESPAWKKRMEKMSRHAKSYVLIGSLSSRRGKGPQKLYNSAFLLGPDGAHEGRYDKVHLVPFGEYVPLGSLLFFVKKLVPVIGRFAEGRKTRLFDVPGGRFGVLICFEIIFPRVVRRMKNARFLVNITNDAWFGHTPASEQHLSMAAMRAVEFRVPIVRSANTGISAIVDATGAIRMRSPLFEKWRMAGEISPRKEGPTFYARTGDAFAITCLLITLAVVGLTMLRPRSGV